MDISIVVPFYKGNKYMEQLFGVVSANAISSEKEIELILVNDSPDVPVEYEEDWVRGFKVKLLVNKENSGIQRSRIEGIKASEGEYIQMLDQDDLLTDDALKSQLGMISNYDMVIGNGIDQGGNHPGRLYKSVSQQKMVLRKRNYFSIGCMITSPGHCLIRKSAIPQEWENLILKNNGADDFLLWLIMMSREYRWTINKKDVYVHVNTGENYSANFDKMKTSTYEAVNLLEQHELLTNKEKKVFLRRYAMRSMYENYGTKVDKLKALLRYPELTIKLIEKKLRGMI